MRAVHSENPYHQQHIQEFANCIDDSLTELQFYYDNELQKFQDTINKLTQRVEKLEVAIAALCPDNKKNPSPVAAEIFITPKSISKLRKDISRYLN